MEECAEAVLERHRAGDPFGVLGLERPGRDALGRARWGAGDADVSRAFRRRSVRVHPDKFPGSALAAEAFDALNVAQSLLLDPVGRAEAVRKAVEEAGLGSEKVAWGAGGAAGGGGSRKRERAGLMRKEGAEMAARIRLQMEGRRKKVEEQKGAQLRAVERERRAGGTRPGQILSTKAPAPAPLVESPPPRRDGGEGGGGRDCDRHSVDSVARGGPSSWGGGRDCDSDSDSVSSSDSKSDSKGVFLTRAAKRRCRRDQYGNRMRPDG